MVLEVANYNCPGQIVVTGQIEALEMATPMLLEKGARRVLPLSVSGAFHSSLLTPASNQLEEVLKTSSLSLPLFLCITTWMEKFMNMKRSKI